MKKNIEELLRENRQELDVESPPSDAWEKIRGEFHSFHEQKKQPAFSWWKVAAVIFLISTVGLIGHNIFLHQRVEELASLGDIAEEYAPIEKSYQTEINQLTSRIHVKEALSQKDLAWMADELKALEEVNKQYRGDIGTDADQELIVQALIDYYEKKIRLLKKLELEINRLENEKRNTSAISAS